MEQELTSSDPTEKQVDPASILDRLLVILALLVQVLCLAVEDVRVSGAGGGNLGKEERERDEKVNRGVDKGDVVERQGARGKSGRRLISQKSRLES